MSSTATRLRRRLVGTLGALAVALLVIGAIPDAAAAAPQLIVTSPASGSATNDTTPTFSGEVGPLEPEVFSSCVTEVAIYAGATTTGTPVQTLPQTVAGECSWATAPAGALEPGTYTAQASGTRSWPEQENPEELSSAPVTFTIDTSAPTPTIASPSPGATITGSSLAVSGSAGTATGDLSTVTVQVFAGGEASGTPVQAIEVPSRGGAWSGAFAGLAPGSYTLRAQQTDWAGNVGASAPVPITLIAPPPPPPPSASFTAFPPSPRVGETVTLVSSSTDLGSPITTYAWSLLPSEALRPGNATVTTVFATAGPHVVRLRIGDAAGRTSLASRTIQVAHRKATLMQPFPIVRIAGRETRRGVKLTLLTVSAPVSSRVTVRVRGGGRSGRTESRVASLGGRLASQGTVLMSFPRFALALPAGETLEVRVTKAGQIGKLTRLIPHVGRLPSRQDLCLSLSSRVMRCPS